MTWEQPIKSLALGLAVLFVLTAMACGSGGTEIRLGQLVADTVTESDANDDEWKSKTYVIEVDSGIPYKVELTSANANTVGIWSADANGYIVEVSPAVTSRTATYMFSKGGSQILFVQSPASDVPSPFAFRIGFP